MFFCEPCQNLYNWPGIVALSYGLCEMCGRKARCFDVPSKYLPPAVREDEPVSEKDPFHGVKTPPRP